MISITLDLNESVILFLRGGYSSGNGAGLLGFLRYNASLSVVMVSPTCSFPVSPIRIRSRPLHHVHPVIPPHCSYLLNPQRPVMRLNKAYSRVTIQVIPARYASFSPALVPARSRTRYRITRYSEICLDHRTPEENIMGSSFYQTCDDAASIHLTCVIQFVPFTPTTFASPYAWALTPPHPPLENLVRASFK